MKEKTEFSKEIILQAYKDMLLARRFEERCANAYGLGLIAGFCHLYTGQEAIIAGVKSVIKKIDHIITAYRCHAHAILFGETPNAVMAELFGRIDGSSKGKGGSMHIFSPENNFWGGHGIVGASASLGTGIAFAEKYKNSDGIVLAFFGDGAANQGQIYESFNMTKLWNLPIIYIIENNCYAMGTSCDRHSATGRDFQNRGASFDIPGEKIDGMDFFAVNEAISRISEKVRKEKIPYLIEFETYRYRGHSMSDPAKYRTKEEVQNIKDQKDCIINLEKYIISEKIANDKDLKKIDNQILEIIEKAYEFAINSQIPNKEELFKNVLIA